MSQTTLFSTLLHGTYAASGTTEPIERYYASMFASFYDKMDSQPCCGTVKAIVRGDRTAPRKLLQYYRDAAHPRCPSKLEEDISALVSCCFADAIRRDALYRTLEAFLQAVPVADAEDLRHSISAGNLIHMWSSLAWYALCGDHHGTASY